MPHLTPTLQASTQGKLHPQLGSFLGRLAALLLLLGPPGAQTLEAQSDDAFPVLTTAAQIRALTPEEAAQQRPIHLRGCFILSETYAFSIQDETDGIFIFSDAENLLSFKRGDLVEVIGVTNPGDYAPCVSATEIRLIGKTTPPSPIETRIAELYTGQMDAKWVEISGIVRSVELLPSTFRQPSHDGTHNLYTKLKLADDQSQVIVELQEVLEPSEYLDAKVRLVGICFYLHNSNRQFVRPIVHTPIGMIPEVLSPPSHDSINSTPRPASSLFTFDHTGGNPGHRVHVRGTVIHQRLGKAIWIRDETQSLQVRSAQQEKLSPGDIVDVLGFPELGTYSPVLQDSEFRKLDHQAPPTPVVLEDIRMISRHNSDLVQLKAKLVEIQRYPESIELTLEGLGTTVRASLLTADGQLALPQWLPGSIVELSGIATVGEGETVPLNGLWWSESLHVLLRSPDDLAIITPAPWWTPQRIAYALAAVLALAIATIAIVVLLSRQRLREQKQQRAMAESEFSAIINERNRVAREIHDTLAQNIGAISVQLELVRPDARNLNESAQRHIQTAHKLARTALADARDSIWNMRSQVLEKYDLGGAIERVATQLTENTGIAIHVKQVGANRRLPPVIENNLLRVGQEAVTNACRHASPKNIHVQISYRKRRVELIVTDDGTGFEIDKVPAETNCSFGLVGIRERVELLGGEVEIQSAPGQGTRIRVDISD